MAFLLFYSPHPECSSICQVGKTQRDSGWGGRGGTGRWGSGGAQWWGHSPWFWYYTPTPLILIVSNLCIHIYIFSTHPCCTFHSLVFPFFFLADESTNEEIYRPKTKEEEDIDTLCSWVQVGGFPAHLEEEATGASVGSEFILFSPSFFCGFLLLFTFLPLFIFFIFQGLGLLKRAGSLKEEAHRLEMEVHCLEDEGLGKMEVVVAGSEVEGFYGILRGAMLHSSISPAPPPNKKICHTPSATTSHLPPQESTGPDVPDPVDQTMKAASPAVPPASEEAIPANMQPLHIHLGAWNEYTSARLRAARRVHQPPMLPSVHMYARCTWEWGWCVPPAANPFLTQTLSFPAP